jgi:hypothetical protein
MHDAHPLIAAAYASLTASGMTCQPGQDADTSLTIQGGGDIVAARVRRVYHRTASHEVVELLDTAGGTNLTVRDGGNAAAAMAGLHESDEDNADLARVQLDNLNEFLNGGAEDWVNGGLKACEEIVSSAKFGARFLDRNEVVSLVRNIARAIASIAYWIGEGSACTAAHRQQGLATIQGLAGEQINILPRDL